MNDPLDDLIESIQDVPDALLRRSDAAQLAALKTYNRNFGGQTPCERIRILVNLLDWLVLPQPIFDQIADMASIECSQSGRSERECLLCGVWSRASDRTRFAVIAILALASAFIVGGFL